MHLALGDRDRALDSLERALRDDSQMIAYLNVDPVFDALRYEPRLRVVARKVGLA